MTFRSAIKTAAHHSGLLRAVHSWRHKNSLTAVMFHRVVNETETSFPYADPEYTVTTKLLIDSISFLHERYSLVGLDNLLLSRHGQVPLPPDSAIITFDDGWRDNLENAAPLLASTPWTVFVSTDALDHNQYWWQDVLLWALRSGAATRQQLWNGASTGTSDQSGDDGSVYALLLRYACLSMDVRAHALGFYLSQFQRAGVGRQMLYPAELATLQSRGADIGGHGASHLPLPLLRDPAADMAKARRQLMDCVGPSSTRAMSFPHGRYNDQIVMAALGLGYQLLFTSDPVLNPAPNGWLRSGVVGRISISASDISDSRGNFSAEKMASWLYLRECRSVSEAY